MSELPYLEVPVTPDSERHWRDLARGVFSVQWEPEHDTWVWYPKAIAPWNPTAQLEWRELPGEGAVYSFSIVHKGEPRFAESGPYVFAYIALDGGPTVFGNVVGDDAREVAIGDRVCLVAPEAVVEFGAARFRRVSMESA